ncbi:hypothetical protein [Blautia sp. 1033sp1_1033st1_G9_1033SCRN_220408]|uniref:hypothetical protein n=1 Tax=Blautia sp. 1033sp1_1033st1_G9_1033SCRN_220408 TaxID=3144490 RepID=UPI0034A136DC
MKKIFKKIMITASGVLLLTCTAAGAWKISGRSRNVLITASFSNRIIEEYQIPDHVNPGQKISKIVNVKNTGTRDSFIRLRITGVLGKRNTEDQLVPDPSLDPAMIQMEFNTEKWKNLGDGYWYYTDILEPGKTTKEPLLKGFWLRKEADNQYKGKDGEILVELESIQASSTALEDLWKVKKEVLGVSESKCRACDTVTKVTVKKDSKIVINEGDADLFANFKDLLPGCARTQSIKINNQSGNSMDLYLKAEDNSGKSQTGVMKKKIETFLGKYVFIQVKEGNKVLYQGAVNGKTKGSGQPLTKGILLGRFLGKTKKELVVKLWVNTEMGNEYQNLTGKVDWVFYGEETDPNNKTADDAGKNDQVANPSSYGNADTKMGMSARISPKTDDSSEISANLCLLVLGISMIAIYKKKAVEFKKGNPEK